MPDYHTSTASSQVLSQDKKHYRLGEVPNPQKGSNFSLTTQKEQIPCSSSAETYQFTKEAYTQKAALDDQQLKDLYQSHLSLGNEPNEYSTTFEMPDTTNSLAQSRREVEDLHSEGVDLRSTNFSMGNAKMNYQSNYGEKFRPYRFKR